MVGQEPETRDDILEAVFGTRNLKACRPDLLESGRRRLMDKLQAQTDPDRRMVYWLAAHKADCAPPPSKAGLTRAYEAYARTAVMVGKTRNL